MVSFKEAHFEKDLILTCVRWYGAYSLSYRQLEELMQERGVSVDHATIQRWALKSSPLREEAFHRRKRPVWRSWRMDEMYSRLKGPWRYLSRAVDKAGQTLDCLLTEQRDERAALGFLSKASRRHGVPDKITMEKREANAAAIRSDNEAHGTTIEIHQVKYLTNLVEQDRRGIKRVIRPLLGFTSFAAAQGRRVGIELMHMIKKGQMVGAEGIEGLTPAAQCYPLAA